MPSPPRGPVPTRSDPAYELGAIDGELLRDKPAHREAEQVDVLRPRASISEAASRAIPATVVRGGRRC